MMEPKSKNLEQIVWFLIVCLPASFACAETSSGKPARTEFVTTPFRKLTQDMNTPGMKVQELAGAGLRRQLWQSWISTARSEKDDENKIKLQELIEQVYAVEFKPQQAPEPVITVEPAESNETTQVPKDKQATEQQQTVNLLPYEPVTEQTLQMLESLLQHPQQINKPFELAEVLYLSGRLKEAAVCYRQALNRTSADEAGAAKDRAWILFQIGNCLRDEDMPAVMDIYRQLIAEYPDSPWTDLARARSELIGWYQKDKPIALITENKF